MAHNQGAAAWHRREQKQDGAGPQTHRLASRKVETVQYIVSTGAGKKKEEKI